MIIFSESTAESSNFQNAKLKDQRFFVIHFRFVFIFVIYLDIYADIHVYIYVDIHFLQLPV